VNKTYDVAGGKVTSYTYAADGGTCSTACHGATTPKWGMTNSVGCSFCHAFPPSDPAHSYHIQNSALLTQAYGNTEIKSDAGSYSFGCGNCHPTDLAKHNDGTVDVNVAQLLSDTNLKQYNQVAGSYSVTPGTTKNGTCSGVYCHSDGSNGASSAFKASPAWNTTASAWDATANKCGQCHDNPPQYASAGAGVAGANSHYNATGFMGTEGGHMVGMHTDNISNKVSGSGLLSTGTTTDSSHGNGTVATTISCDLCHSGVTGTIDTYAMNGTSSWFKCGACHTDATPTKLRNGSIADKSLHINGVKNVIFAEVSVKSKAQLRDGSKPDVWTRTGGYNTSGSYDAAMLNGTWDSGTKTCTTACHNNKQATWGDTNLTCVSCHESL
jgi:predicted CxxxxCH...CXXCH cytochrome family protein